MQARFASAVLLGFVLIAGAACSGSDGLSEAEEEALQERVEQAELEAAEAERRRLAEEEAREEAEAAAKESEEEAADAQQAEQEAEAAAAEAERLRQVEEAARLAAQAERNRLAAEAEARRKADALERARTAIAGTQMIGDDATLAFNTPLTITFGEPAPVTTPSGPFTTTQGRSGRWSTTSLTAIAEPTRDMIQIYTDVEADTRELFSGSPLNTTNVGGPGSPAAVIDGEGDVVGWVDIQTGTPNRIATSGSFPRDIGPAEPFTLIDRGEYTVAQREADNADPNSNIIPDTYRGPYRDESRFPEQWAYETSGFLQGASGRYRCDSASEPAARACTVQNNGGTFTFVGDWDFIPSSGTVRIVVPDAQYMWFGVWAQQTVRDATVTTRPTEIWEFEANHGGTHAVSDLAGATGSATYNGPAFGRYAVYEPDTGDSGIGSFTASATLQADFDASPNTVSGTITGFSNDPSWSLALKRGNIDGGDVENDGTTAHNPGQGDDPGGVTWTIDGIPDDSGTWEAQFYNNLPATTVTYQPHGIAGTFEAGYDPSGVGERAALIGAFGAHR